MPVSDIARTDVVTAAPDDDLRAVGRRMVEEDVGSVVVVEGDDPAGIVTDRQIAVAATEEGDVSELAAADVMTEDPITIMGDEGIDELAERLQRGAIRRMPVIDEDGALAGIVTLDDLLVLLSREFDLAADVIEEQSPQY